MPSHWGHPRLNVVTQSSPTGTQFLQAVGCAEAGPVPRGRPRAGARLPPSPATRSSTARPATARRPRASSGRASTPPATCKLPVLYLVEDNGYAISVPVEVQTAGGSISQLVRSFPEPARARGGRLRPAREPRRSCARRPPGAAPARGRRSCTRTSSAPTRTRSPTTRRLYRAAAEREADAQRDPLARCSRSASLEEGVATADELARAARGRRPRGGRRPPTRRSPRRPPRPQSATLPRLLARRRPDLGRASPPSPSPQGDPKTMVDLLNACLHDEMARDPRIVVFGAGRGRLLARGEPRRGQGQGRRLQGHAQPAAAARLAPRLQHARSPRPTSSAAPSAWPRAASSRSSRSSSSTTSGPPSCRSATSSPLIRWRSNGAFKCPRGDPRDLRRLPAGRGGLPQPVRRGRSSPTCPGLRVVIPSNAQDANGLLRTAIRCDDPVLFLEHKHLYRQTYNKGVYPGPDYTIPFGKAALRARGPRRHRRDLRRARAALAASPRSSSRSRASRPRCSTCARSAPTTGTRSRPACARPGAWSWPTRTASPGATAPRSRPGSAEELFEHLDAPVRRVGALDTFVGYNPSLEDAILPQVATIAAALRETARY